MAKVFSINDKRDQNDDGNSLQNDHFEPIVIKGNHGRTITITIMETVPINVNSNQEDSRADNAKEVNPIVLGKVRDSDEFGSFVKNVSTGHAFDPFLHRKILREVLDEKLQGMFANHDSDMAKYFSDLSMSFEKLKARTEGNQ